MKIKWNKRYLTIAVYAFLVIAFAILFFRVTENIGIESLRPARILAMLTPILIGLVIAYLVNLLLTLFETKLLNRGRFKTMKPEKKRGIALLLSYLSFILIVIAFLGMLLPRLVESAQALVTSVPQNIGNTTEWVQEFIRNRNWDVQIEKYLTEQWQNLVAWVNGFLTNTLPHVGGFLLSTLTNLINFFLGFILSIYFLIRKEHYGGIVNKMLFAWLPIGAAERTIEIATRMDTLMKQYIKGQLLVSFTLSVFFFVIMLLMGTPYPLLLTFILFVTDLIPVVGPWIGSIPVILLIFLSNPVKGLWFILVILVGQQLEANVVSPRIQGQQMGVSAFWILVTLIVANHFFGLVGMVVGLPVFVLIYSLMRDTVNERLEARGLSTEMDDYIGVSKKSLPVEADAVPITAAIDREEFSSDDSPAEAPENEEES